MRASSTVGSWIGLSLAAALVGLWIWFGQMLAIVVGTTILLIGLIKRRFPNRLAAHGLLALTSGAITLVIARKVFAGGGIRQTQIASLGPWVVPTAVVLSVWVAPWVAPWLVAGLVADGWARIIRWAIACTAAVLSMGALVLDAHAPGGLLFPHVLLLALGLALASQAVELIRLPPRSGYAALALSLLTLPSLVALPASRPARQLLAQSTWAGAELIDYAKFHADLDHDGYSPLFGGGDCDDGDASVFTGAVERPGDGRDSDCDGLDDPKASGLLFEPFHPKSDGTAQQISDRAKQFPTVVILVDALRFDRIGNPRFPNLAQLSRESIRFTHVYSTSATTLTSVPVIMRGRVHSVSGEENIAQSLTHAGQSSAFIAPDVVTEHFRKLGRLDPVRSFSKRRTIPTDHASSWDGGDTISTSDQLTSAAVEELDSAESPNLLWLHYFDVHQWNILGDEGLPARGDVARYDAVVERLDASLRPLLERRDRLNLVLLADHGEGLGDRGIKYHTHFIFEELTRIPLLVRVPGSVPTTVDTPVTSPGVFNMLRALRGLEPDATADQSLLALVGSPSPGDGPGFPGFDDAQWSFLYGSHRLLYMPRQQLLELYDLERDPLERNNQADENPQLASQLLTRLFQIHNQLRE
ncbi:MAG: sulfatase-like hydrolase/transferase [Pseudomonadota bacterium]